MHDTIAAAVQAAFPGATNTHVARIVRESLSKWGGFIRGAIPPGWRKVVFGATPVMAAPLKSTRLALRLAEPVTTLAMNLNHSIRRIGHDHSPFDRS